MQDDELAVKITFRVGGRISPLFVAQKLSNFFLSFDVTETKIDFVSGDPDDIHDTKRVMGLA